MANSVDPDQMPHFVASDLDLYCLPKDICLNTKSKYIGHNMFLLFFRCFLTPDSLSHIQAKEHREESE